MRDVFSQARVHVCSVEAFSLSSPLTSQAVGRAGLQQCSASDSLDYPKNSHLALP